MRSPRRKLSRAPFGYAMVLALLLLLVISLWGARSLIGTRETLRQGGDRVRYRTGRLGAEGAVEVAKGEIERLLRSDGLDYADLDFNKLRTNDTIGYIFTGNRNSGNWQRCSGSVLQGHCLYKTMQRAGNINYSLLLVPAGDVYRNSEDSLVVEYYVGIKASSVKSGAPAFGNSESDLASWSIKAPTLSGSNSAVDSYLTANGGTLNTRVYGFVARYFALPGGLNQQFLGKIKILHNPNTVDQWLFVPNEADQTLSIVRTKTWTVYQPIPLKYPNPCRVWVDPYWNRFVFISHCPDRNAAGNIPVDSTGVGVYPWPAGQKAPMHTSILMFDNLGDPNNASYQPKDHVVYLDQVYAPVKAAVKNVQFQDIDFNRNGVGAAAIDKFGKLFYINMTGGTLNFGTAVDLCPASTNCEAADRVFNYVDGSGGLFNRVQLRPGGKAYASLVVPNKTVRFNLVSPPTTVWTTDLSSDVLDSGEDLQIFEGTLFAKDASATYGLAINNKYEKKSAFDADGRRYYIDDNDPGFASGSILRKIGETAGDIYTSSDNNFWTYANNMAPMIALDHSYYNTSGTVVDDKRVVLPAFRTLYDTQYFRIIGQASSSFFSYSRDGIVKDTSNYNATFRSFNYLLGDLLGLSVPVETVIDFYSADLSQSTVNLTALGSIGGLPVEKTTEALPSCFDPETLNYYSPIGGFCPSGTIAFDIPTATAISLSRQGHCFNSTCSLPLTKIGAVADYNFETGYGAIVSFPGCDLHGRCNIADSQPHFSRVAKNGFTCVAITGRGSKLFYFPCLGSADATHSLTITTNTPVEVEGVTYPIHGAFGEVRGSASPGYSGGTFSFVVP